MHFMKYATGSAVVLGLCVFGLLLGFFPSYCQAQPAATQGQWSSQETWPTRAIHTSLLPDGRVFFFSYYDEALQPHIWDPATDTFAPTAASSYSLFCAGHTTLADGRIFDMPQQRRERYQVQQVRSRHAIWRFNHKCRTLPAGRVLRIELLAAGSVRWSADGWQTIHDMATIDSGLGVHYADLDSAHLAVDREVVFTFYWSAENRWEGVNYTLRVI